MTLLLSLDTLRSHPAALVSIPIFLLPSPILAYAVHLDPSSISLRRDNKTLTAVRVEKHSVAVPQGPSPYRNHRVKQD
ncbi:uncharacterized protein LY79DRAFT_556425 [Colletotrichum navitas]|uniref:Uncharacterized protein n=1 Tax=Colletotrichum navitas TaxID=681940 RepID=A0AAD8V4Y8_9PEZI|nr:uncharacterized protein LY79DRAFT_556425 [Colletotrichum navitas]KAK1589834.1 hypothetical protein LY79DRAFT_556425 [Colletotrichum navitas]